MEVFKFGGASVKDSEGVKNLVDILSKKNMIDIPFRYGPYPKSFNFIRKILEKI